MLRIVGIGGGTGLPLVLRGLADLEASGEVAGLCLTSIVCVSDDGGSSGRLRRTLRVPALGDIRNCMLGLAPRESVWSQLLPYRFANGRGLAGHSLGNLMLAALCQQTGSLCRAIELVSASMQLAGTVLPATETPVTLAACGRDGRPVRGECAIAAARMRIDRVWLDPDSPDPSRGVLESLDAADVIVLGPGSLFTSVIPPLLVAGVADAIRRSRAVRIYVCNLMAQPGETDGFTAGDHVRTLFQYLGDQTIDVCILNARPPAGRLARRYLATGATPIAPDVDAIRALGPAAVQADLIAEDGPKARHTPRALARLLVDIAQASVASSVRSPKTKVETPCVESSVT
jgi:uncharacterized cofD-like protein